MIKYILLSLLLMSFGVSAKELVCSGTVESVSYHGNDKLMVKLSSMNTPVFFCNPNDDWSVPSEPGRVMKPETCKAVFSMFLTARATKERLSRVHFDGDQLPDNCDEFENWKSVFIRYVNY